MDGAAARLERGHQPDAALARGEARLRRRGGAARPGLQLPPGHCQVASHHTEFIISNMATIAFFRRRMQTSHQLGKGDKYKTVIGTLKTVYRYIQLLLDHFITY